MKVLKQISDTKRIVQRKNYFFLWNYLWEVSYQEKGGFGWKTLHSLLTGQYESIEEYEEHFHWAMKNRPIGEFKQF